MFCFGLGCAKFAKKDLSKKKYEMGTFGILDFVPFFGGVLVFLNLKCVCVCGIYLSINQSIHHR